MSNSWPIGSGSWNRIRMLIVSDVLPHRGAVESGALIVATPLELILHLEHAEIAISTVVLEGRFAEATATFAAALRELYPELGIARREAGVCTVC